MKKGIDRWDRVADTVVVAGKHGTARDTGDAERHGRQQVNLSDPLVATALVGWYGLAVAIVLIIGRRNRRAV